jgi:hypothetical protein
MIEVFVPRESVNDRSVVVQRIHVLNKSPVQRGDIVVCIETSKTVIELGAPSDGYVKHQLSVGDELGISEKIFSIHDDLNEFDNVELPRLHDDDKCVSPTLIKNDQPLGVNLFSKKALSRIEKIGLSKTSDYIWPQRWVTEALVDEVVGSKPGLVDALTTSGVPEGLGVICPYSLNKFTKRKRSEVDSLKGMGANDLRSTISIKVQTSGVRSVGSPYLFSKSISDLVVYESSRLLKKYKELNGAYINEREWIAYEAVNFGWSFDGGRNLKVFTIRDADKLGLLEIQEKVLMFLELYESNETIPMEILTGSTVTLSDLTQTKASFMLPLINGTQSLILGLTQPLEGTYEIIASFDHRVAEGMTVAKFLEELSDRVGSYFEVRNPLNQIKCVVCEKTLREEIMEGHRGMLIVATNDGAGCHICRGCFDGW